MNKRPTVLVILDGFGVASPGLDNAISAAHTPCLDYLKEHYFSTILSASGTAVGLPDGYNGNSEVGHITIGAGRIVQQPITRLLQMVADGSLAYNNVVRDLCATVIKRKGAVHLMGLLSDGGVHSHELYMYALIETLFLHGATRIVVHPFLDGRDVSPQSAAVYLTRLEKVLAQRGVGVIGSLHGRFYAMDRDHNLDRTGRSFHVLTEPSKVYTDGWRSALDVSYAHGKTDEFLEPVLLCKDGIVQDGDGILFCNVRADRARQLVHLFASTKKKLQMITMVAYDTIPGIKVLLDIKHLDNTLKERLAVSGKRVFSIAETEKYAHITYFFGGGQEELFSQETRVLIPSKVVHDYAHEPRMSADAITDAVIESLQIDTHDFYLINYANADMVGHSGDFTATVQAVSCLDEQIERLYRLVKAMDGIMYITSDHGKAEDMVDDALDKPRTAHTSNKVPFIATSEHLISGKLMGLADIAPYILLNMDLDIPLEMTGD